MQHVVSGQWVTCSGVEVNIDPFSRQQNTFQVDLASNVGIQTGRR